MSSIFIFDAYGTLFDVHAAIARHRAQVGPDADRISAVWRTKQLEYSWTLTLAGHYVDFWQRSAHLIMHSPKRRLSTNRSGPDCWMPISSSMLSLTRVRRYARSSAKGIGPGFFPMGPRRCSTEL